MQLPRLYLAWQTPGLYAPGDAALDLLGRHPLDGKSAGSPKRLVMEERIAQDVMAGQQSMALAGMFLVVATPKPGTRVTSGWSRRSTRSSRASPPTPPTEEELQRAKNRWSRRRSSASSRWAASAAGPPT